MAGERKSVTELDRTVEYTYDSLYSLTSETITEGEKVTTYTYAYDNVSNRILKTENGAETEYVYNALNQLVSDSDISYEYDLNGNLVRVIGTDKSALYEFNAENKLIKATVQNGNLVIEESYTYDYEGNRTSKTTRTSDGSVEYTKYLNDTNSSLTNVLAEIDEIGTAKCTYTIGADLISQERDGKVSVYLYDGHSSVVGLATMSGKVTDTYCYDAFGNLIDSTGSTKNCYRYCGEQFDETTGLYYLRARYMDTTTGRFISQDSYAGSIDDPVSLHKYLYANANPVMYSDPSGYMTLGSVSISGAIIGVLSSAAVSGIINVGISLIRDIKGDSPQETSYYVSMFLEAFVDGLVTAAIFASFGIMATLLSSAAIWYALGGSSVLMALVSFGAAIAAGQAGEDEVALVYIILGIGGLVAADACFSNAMACYSATSTASGTTDPSTDNTQTASDAGGNNNSTSSSTCKNNSNKGGGAKRAKQYRNNWSKGNLKDTVQNIAPDSEGVVSSNGQKMIFENSDTGKSVVYDVEGDYFRVMDKNISGKRCYTDIDGNPISNNVTINGKQRGITQAEYNQMTHFR